MSLLVWKEPQFDSFRYSVNPTTEYLGILHTYSHYYGFSVVNKIHFVIVTQV